MTWPTRREVWATTIVVILISLVFGIYLYVVDLSLSALVAWIFQKVGRNARGDRDDAEARRH